MGAFYNISRRIFISIIITVLLLIIMGNGLDMYRSLLISLGFGTSISLWRLSYNFKEGIEG